MPIHDATLDYIGGIDPKLQWEARGISGHNKKEKKELEIQKNKKSNFLNTTKGAKKLKAFLNEAQEIFYKLLSKNKNWIKDYFKNKKFIFIIGTMRTAGTYLYKELSQILNIQWQNLNIKMTHDSIPTYIYVERWKTPRFWLPLLFELAQFLTWAKKECMGQKAIIQKRIAYGHALPLLNNLFGKNAEYVITVRHPGAIATSFKKMEKIDMKTRFEPGLWKYLAEKKKGISKKEWKNMNYNERTLIYWQIYYEDIVKYGLPEGNMSVLKYGKKESEGFLYNFAQRNNKNYTLEKFKVSKRNYSEFWYSDKVNEIIKQVSLWWQVHGLQFPELELK